MASKKNDKVDFGVHWVYGLLVMFMPSSNYVYNNASLQFRWILDLSVFSLRTVIK